MPRHRVRPRVTAFAHRRTRRSPRSRAGEFGDAIVVKADGLAAGKGVVVAQSAWRPRRRARDHGATVRFGDAGARVVLEECLVGAEVSFFVLADGERAVPLLSAQDHKRIFDGDRGPNTGGMGAFSPSPLIDATHAPRNHGAVVQPVLEGMAAEGNPFRGFLYCGLMLTAGGPKVIEFNVASAIPRRRSCCR